MDFLTTVILLSIFSIHGKTDSKHIDHKIPTYYIFNGDDARDGEFPWMAMLANYQGLLHCGAALIDRRHVLTAAHCTLGMPTENPPMIAVFLGVHNIDYVGDAEVKARVARVIRHPNNRFPYHNFDFAILELEEDVPTSEKVRPICLSRHGLNLDGQNATVTGWGMYNSNSLSKVLQKAVIPIWNLEKCKRAYEKEDNDDVDEDMLCAGDTVNGRDACAYDSGGPLAWQDQSGRWYLVGIVSWGAECGGDLPGVYGNVSSVHDWITSKTNYSSCD